MPTNPSPNDQHVTITIEDCSFPDDSHETIREALQTAIENCLNDHDAPATVTVRLDRRFPAVNDDCPLCGEHLELYDSQLDAENGATASAVCPSDDCDWTGTAIYRIIDHEWGPVTDRTSAVADGHVTPSWYPY